MATVIRLGALALGLTCTGLGCYGAFEFAYKLEGEVTYLVLAAPVIAATAALIPPIAEAGEAGTLSRPSSGGPYSFGRGPFSAAERGPHGEGRRRGPARCSSGVPRRGPRRDWRGRSRVGEVWADEDVRPT
jgi:hypothetical protein